MEENRAKVTNCTKHAIGVRLINGIERNIPAGGYFKLPKEDIEYNMSIAPSLFAVPCQLRVEDEELNELAGIDLSVENLTTDEAVIEKKLKVTLPQDEAAFIALHIVNAELDLDMTSMVSMTKFVNHILDIVDECFGNRIDKESVFYERFVTHLKFFAQRIFAGKEVESDDTEFQEIIRNKYQDCIDCVEKIKAYIKETCNHDVTDEEMMYLTVHVKRVTTK